VAGSLPRRRDLFAEGDDDDDGGGGGGGCASGLVKAVYATLTCEPGERD